jgi:hypothetical protein
LTEFELTLGFERTRTPGDTVHTTDPTPNGGRGPSLGLGRGVVRLVEVGTGADDGVASDGDGVVNDAIADSVDLATADDDEGLVGVGLPQAATATASRNQPVRDQVRRVSMRGRRYDRAVVAPLGGLRCAAGGRPDPSVIVVSPVDQPAHVPPRRRRLAYWQAGLEWIADQRDWRVKDRSWYEREALRFDRR